MINYFVFVEGNTDKEFVNNILSVLFLEKKSIILQPIPYQRRKNDTINKIVKTAQHSNKLNYFLLSDLDSHTYPCITSRKNRRKEEYRALDYNKIFIVKEEIESWYVAGVDTQLEQFNGLNIPDNTDNLSKEDVDAIIDNSSFDSSIEFLNEILKNFNFDLAYKRNTSFRYFIDKFGLNDN